MKNPNNNLIPNLYTEDERSCENWVVSCRQSGVYRYLSDPLSYINNGLTSAEGKFLDNLKQKVEGILDRSVAPTREEILEHAAEKYGYCGLFGMRDNLKESLDYAMELIETRIPQGHRAEAYVALGVVCNTHAYDRAKQELEAIL